MQVELLQNGIKIRCEKRLGKNPDCKVECPDEKQKSRRSRGCITGFSEKSSGRLKEYLLRLQIPSGKRLVSWCLTLPNVDIERWDAIFKRYCENMKYCEIGFIWRVELQKRKVPHLHCLAPLTIEQALEIRRIWYNSIGDEMYDGRPIVSYDGFMVYGVAVSFVRDSRAMRYLCQHTSKHKSSQLGWKGRQWGVVGRKFLQFSEGKIIPLNYRELSNLEEYIWKRYPFLAGRSIDSLVGYRFFEEEIGFSEILASENVQR